MASDGQQQDLASTTSSASWLGIPPFKGIPANTLYVLADESSSLCLLGVAEHATCWIVQMVHRAPPRDILYREFGRDGLGQKSYPSTGRSIRPCPSCASSPETLWKGWMRRLRRFHNARPPAVGRVERRRPCRDAEHRKSSRTGPTGRPRHSVRRGPETSPNQLQVQGLPARDDRGRLGCPGLSPGISGCWPGMR